MGSGGERYQSKEDKISTLMVNKGEQFLSASAQPSSLSALFLSRLDVLPEGIVQWDSGGQGSVFLAGYGASWSFSANQIQCTKRQIREDKTARLAIQCSVLPLSKRPRKKIRQVSGRPLGLDIVCIAMSSCWCTMGWRRFGVGDRTPWRIRTTLSALETVLITGTLPSHRKEADCIYTLDRNTPPAILHSHTAKAIKVDS